MRKHHWLSIMLACGFVNVHAWQDYEYIEDEFDQFASTLQPVQQAQQRNPAVVTAQSVLDIIAAPPILLQDRLLQDFYLFTNGPFRTRSLLDQPWALLSGCPCDGFWHLNVWYFYNQTTEANYTKNGKNISSYLNLGEASLFEGIEEIGLDIDFPTIFEIIGIMRMQERRTGFMIGWCKGHNNWCFEWKFPIYYLERNFHLTDDEKKRIQAALFFDDNDSDETSDAELKKHAVSDQLGIGDTRFNAAYKVFEEPGGALEVGALLTAPTAFAFVKGIVGSNFKKNSLAPYLDFLELFRLVLCFNDTARAIELLRTFGETIFDKLSANLLQTSLGNNGHFGIGLFGYAWYESMYETVVEARAEIEYLLPKREKKFFIEQKDPRAFAAREPYTTDEGADPAQAPGKLDFLNQQFIDTFIPDVFVTTVYPGLLLKLCGDISKEFGQNWCACLGGDGWLQSRERFGRISANRITRERLKTSIARNPLAYQTKIFARIEYARATERLDWRASLYADYTVFSSGIGQDFSIVGNVIFNF